MPDMSEFRIVIADEFLKESELANGVLGTLKAKLDTIFHTT